MAEEVASIRIGQQRSNFGARVEDALLAILVHFEGAPNFRNLKYNLIWAFFTLFIMLNLLSSIGPMVCSV